MFDDGGKYRWSGKVLVGYGDCISVGCRRSETLPDLTGFEACEYARAIDCYTSAYSSDPINRKREEEGIVIERPSLLSERSCFEHNRTNFAMTEKNTVQTAMTEKTSSNQVNKSLGRDQVHPKPFDTRCVDTILPQHHHLVCAIIHSMLKLGKIRK